MSTVTIPRELAQSVLVLLHRTYSGDAVPGGTYALIMHDLETALASPENTPRTAQDAPGSTQETPPTPGTCRFCRVALSDDQGLCKQCADDLLRDAQELEASKSVCCFCKETTDA